MKGKKMKNKRKMMDNPSFGCHWETMMIIEYRNLKMYAENAICSIIMKTV
jgi:hypothetical protein